ncbi:efflux RND transporter periplasmic adaptor subunit [Granulicella mallensis]|uniref:Multidrug efflux system membrane fusion protein n=1 Tax=Granulicella mallensis TaxID=940614 RepID=A0A7W7ZPI9_9BACT|nr:efflux RND transporter periplasmic adaptor subunit [Granulicella mallensis]MBB5063372.1 multidrug efflux system membrane fusion protein [Granulicella mallensis]
MQSDSNERPIIGTDHQLPAPPPEKPKQSGVVRLIVWVLLLLIFGVGFFLVLRHHDEPKPATGRHAAGGTATITTVTAQQGNIGVYLDSIGTVTPVYTSSITSQVNGIVTAVHYKEGQLVRKGDPLIDIDSRIYRASLLEAQGTLEKDQAVLAQAQMDLERYQAAWVRNAIPKQTLDDQEKIVLQDQGTVKNDQGTVQFDQIQVDYCHIVAPFTGRVGLRLVDPGNVVQSTGGTTLAVITQIQPITVIFTIPEDNLGQVQPALRKKAKLDVDAYDRTGLKQITSGSLLTLDNQIDTTTGTVKARASFDNKDSVLYPNEFVNTRLLVNTLQNATLVPTSAIQHNGQVAFVYVIQDNLAHLKNVKAGVTDGDTTEVTGINPGDVLADSSFDKLQDKAKVVISKQPVPTSGATGSTAP